MKKIKIIPIELIILIFLIITPLVSSLDAGSFNQTTQNMCGDGICEPGETASTCPQDCSNPTTTIPSPPLNSPSNISNQSVPPTQENIPSSEIQNNFSSPTPSNNISTQQNNFSSPSQTASNKEVFFVSTTFQIIIGIIIFIVIALIVYLLIKNRNKPKQAVSNTSPIQQ